MKSESASDSDDTEEIKLTIDTEIESKSNSNLSQNSYPSSNYPDNVIENLWNAKAMGNYGPEEILVALWFYISHYFGLSSRIDHAKLNLGNVVISQDNCGRKKLVFHKLPTSSFNTKFSAQPIYELPNDRNKCPVAIYETYLQHRPSNICDSTSPFYLQLEKTLDPSTKTWFCAVRMGKNRIGSLFNSALSKCGQPTVRHYNSRRQLLTSLKPIPIPIPIPILISSESSEIIEKSPKIRLKISRLNSGNPIVTQTLIDGSEIPVTSLKRKVESEFVESTIKEPKLEDSENCNELFSIRSPKTFIKTPKRAWSLQKCIITVTSKETNPILRQLMMHLGMTKDILLPQDQTSISSSNKKDIRKSDQMASLPSSTTTTVPTNSNLIGGITNNITGRALRSNHRLFSQLPEWHPTIDGFCDEELQKLMSYSFDCYDNESTNEIIPTV